MKTSDFNGFFHAATGNRPYDYQVRLAESPCESRLISIPTGLGKTAAVILAWLWNRVSSPSRVSNRVRQEAATLGGNSIHQLNNDAQRSQCSQYPVFSPEVSSYPGSQIPFTTHEVSKPNQ